MKEEPRVQLKYYGRDMLGKALAACERQRRRLQDELTTAVEPREFEIRLDMLRLSSTEAALQGRMRRLDRLFGNTMTPYLHKTVPWDTIDDENDH